MPEPIKGKKLVVIKSGKRGESTAMELREVDRETDLMVFDAEGKLQTREGQFFGADKVNSDAPATDQYLAALRDVLFFKHSLLRLDVEGSRTGFTSSFRSKKQKKHNNKKRRPIFVHCL